MVDNIEIKACHPDPDTVRRYLRGHGADFKGTDHQIDTYYEVSTGRLKLREGNIENSLIYYEREDAEGPKHSRVILVPQRPDSGIKELLGKVLRTKVVVDKRREIYFIGNVKFHIDDVEGLGGFIEIEAIDRDGTLGLAHLREQCDRYLREFDIRKEDLLSCSYSDLLLELRRPR